MELIQVTVVIYLFCSLSSIKFKSENLKSNTVQTSQVFSQTTPRSTDLAFLSVIPYYLDHSHSTYFVLLLSEVEFFCNLPFRMILTNLDFCRQFQQPTYQYSPSWLFKGCPAAVYSCCLATDDVLAFCQTCLSILLLIFLKDLPGHVWFPFLVPLA